MKSRVLSSMDCTFFEYSIEEDIPGKLGEAGGIFFDITKIEIICFNTGICFLLIKTALNNNSSFSDVLNFNYKFRDIHSNIGHKKEYDNIKIQTHKLGNMKKFNELLNEIVGSNLLAKQANIDTERLITYSYTCLDQNSWNETTDLKLIENEFEKYRNVLPANEQITYNDNKKDNVYEEKYLYYGFLANSVVLLASDSNIKNYTNLLFSYENEQLYHYIYSLHQKIYMKKLDYEISKNGVFKKAQSEFIKFAKTGCIYEITNDVKGIAFEKYIRKVQNLDEIFSKLKLKYDLLYKNYEVQKVNRHNKILIAIIVIIIAINIIKICF